MKDRLGLQKRLDSMLWNQAPRNPTQTMYRRFRSMPHTDLSNDFTRHQEDFTNRLKLARRSWVSDYLDDSE